MKVLDFNAHSIAMRIITNKEWDRLMDVTQENDEISHWRKMFSLVNDTDNRYDLKKSYRASRGCNSARYWSNFSAFSASFRYALLGFRPVVELTADALPPDTQDGDMMVIGTLYMDGKPVRVPRQPTWDGDIADYIPAAKLEMRPALDDPDYQVKGIYVGSNVFVADRNLLKNISFRGLEIALRNKTSDDLLGLLRELTAGYCCKWCVNSYFCEDCHETTLCASFTPNTEYVLAVTDALR